MTTYHLQIWLARTPDFFAERLSTFPNARQFRHVADLKIDADSEDLALEKAFTLTQHGYQKAAPNWQDGPAVTFVHDREARSLSVGDVVVLNGQAHGVLGMGFRTLNPHAGTEPA